MIDWLREVFADEAHAALGGEALAVEGDDAGRFLAAMLEGVEAERGDRGRIGMAENAEDAAFLAQRVAVEIEVRERGWGGESVFVRRVRHGCPRTRRRRSERRQRLGGPTRGTPPVDVT